jgi:integrase
MLCRGGLRCLAAAQEILPRGWRRSRPPGRRGIGIHSLRKTAINDDTRNGASMHEVREFVGHADIRTTEVYFVRREEDAEVAARRI